MLLQKSQFLQIIEGNDMFAAYHSLFGFPQIIDENAISLMELFSKPSDPHKIIQFKSFDNAEATIKTLLEYYFLVPLEFDERLALQKKAYEYQESLTEGGSIDYLSLIVSEACNFACNYCIAHSIIDVSHRKWNKNRLMSVEMAKHAIDIFASILEKSNKTTADINFGGGEPLLNWKTVEESLKYCQEKYGQCFNFSFCINTNGSLINTHIAKTLKAYNVKTAISLDGLKEANDKVRLSRAGRSTFKKIISAFNILESVDFKTDGFATTITNDNFQMINEEIIDFAKDQGFTNIRIDLDVIHANSIPATDAVLKLHSLKRYAKSQGIYLTGFWERPAENLNFSFLEKHIAFCGGSGGKSMCVSPRGEVFICGYSAKKFADISDGCLQIATDKYLDIVGKRMVGNIERCRGCIIEGQCIGGCHVTEEFEALGEQSAINYNCELYRQMTIELIKDSIEEDISS